jgi:hypothetical protein
MPWVSKVALRMRSLLRPDALDHEHDDALRFPVEQQIAENIGPENLRERVHCAALGESAGVNQI